MFLGIHRGVSNISRDVSRRAVSHKFNSIVTYIFTRETCFYK